MRTYSLTAALLIFACVANAADSKPTVVFENGKNGKPERVVVAGLDDATLNACKQRKPDAAAWAPHAQVQVADGTAKETADRPPLLGSWRVDGKRLLFEPRF